METSLPDFLPLSQPSALQDVLPGPFQSRGSSISGARPICYSHFYQGARVQLEPGALGAAFFIVTVIVPPLLVTHALIFWILAVKHGHATTSASEHKRSVA